MLHDITETEKLFDWTRINRETLLKYSSRLNDVEKLVHYKTPDYCIVAPARTVIFLLLELERLYNKSYGQSGVSHVYFQIYREIKKPEDFDNGPNLG